MAADGPDEAEILDEAVRSVAEALRLDLAKYLELTPHQDAFVLRAAVGWPRDLVGVATVPAGARRSHAGFVVAEGHPVPVLDYRTEARFTPSPLLSQHGVVSGIAVPVYTHEGHPLGVLGGQSRRRRAFGEDEAAFLQTVADIVSVGVLRQRGEDRFRKLVQNSSDLITIVNDKCELVYSSPAAERMLGIATAHVGRNMLLSVHPEDRQATADAFFREVLGPGLDHPVVFRFRTGLGEWRVLEVVATNCMDDPAVGGVVVNARDVTERANLTRALRTLAKSNQVLVNASDEASLLSGACQTIVDAGNYRLAWVGYVEQGEARMVRPVASAGAGGYLEKLTVSWADNEHGRGPTGTAVRSRRVQVTADLSGDGAFAPWRASAAEFGLRSSCALPLEVEGEVIGTLGIYAGEPDAFGPAEVALLGELAGALAYGIGRLRDAASLQASEERFRSLAGAAPIGILEFSPVAMVKYANPRMAEITGRSASELMGRGWVDAVHPEDTPKLLALVELVAPDRSQVAVTFKICRPDGEVRHVRLLAAPRGQNPGGRLCRHRRRHHRGAEGPGGPRSPGVLRHPYRPAEPFAVPRPAEPGVGPAPSRWLQDRCAVRRPRPLQGRERRSRPRNRRRRTEGGRGPFSARGAGRRNGRPLQRRRVCVHYPGRPWRPGRGGSGKTAPGLAGTAYPVRGPRPYRDREHRYRDPRCPGRCRDHPA